MHANRLAVVGVDGDGVRGRIEQVDPLGVQFHGRDSGKTLTGSGSATVPSGVAAARTMPTPATGCWPVKPEVVLASVAASSMDGSS
jgi:hypothetical protein